MHVNISWVATVVLVGMLIGCATSQTDADKVSAFDLWIGKDRLDQHLSEKRAELNRVYDQAAEFQHRAYKESKALRKIEAELRREIQNGVKISEERAELLNDIAIERENLDFQIEDMGQARGKAVELLKRNDAASQASFTEVELEKSKQELLLVQQKIEQVIVRSNELKSDARVK